MKNIIGILIIIIISIGCQRNNLSILDKAEQYTYRFHDSTRVLLEKIVIDDLTEEELARYYLVKNFMARYTARREVSDSALYISEKFYRQANDKKRLAEILLLQGWDNYSKKEDYNLAEEKYKESLELWMLLNDSSKIMRTYWELSWVADRQNEKDSMLSLLHAALPYSRNIDRISLYMYIGDLYDRKGDTVKAIEYYRLANKEATDCNDHYIFQTIRNRLVQMYTKNEMHKEAFHELDTFRMMRKGRYETSYSTLARAEIWLRAHEYDSAFHYYSLASQSVNSYVATRANSRLANLHHIKGDYKSAMYALQNFIELWELDANAVESGYMKEKYDEMKLKNELNEIKLAKRNRELYLLLFFIIVSLCLITGYIIHLRNKKNKEEQRLKQQAEILEKENKLLKQAEELSKLHEKEAGLREALFKKMTVFHKIPSLENGNHKETDDKRIILSDKDWEELIQIVDSTYDGFADRLKQQYPLLTAKDIQFCCLVKINVTLKDLSDIYCVSKAAITKKKFRIKTEKLAFADADKSLDDFLERF